MGILASQVEDDASHALRFSMSSDIVELVVLTVDEIFLQTLREALGSARRVWHVPSGTQVGDLLIAGQVGIVVLDVDALSEAAEVFIGEIKRQFPDLVVVVAGQRDAEIALAGLISAGTVYRFIHKPMSPGRAKLFAEAAIRRHDEQRRSVQAPASSGASSRSRSWLIAAIVGLILIGAVAWYSRGHSVGMEAGRQGGVTASQSAQSTLLARAAAAQLANRLTEPPGDNALELYLQATARSPADPAARLGLTEVRERLLARAENSLLEERLEEAAAAIETARRSGVESGRIAFLSAQLAKSQSQVRAAQAAGRARAELKSDRRAGPVEDGVTPLLTLAAQRMTDGHLIDPDGDSARYFVQAALRLDAGNEAALEARQVLALRLLGEARAAIERRDFAHAAGWIDGAEEIASRDNIAASRTLLERARKQAQTDALNQLLRNIGERLQQDHLIDPPEDSAKYYLLALRHLDPGNAGLSAAVHDLGSRLTAKARLALTLGQYDAAHSWLDEAAGIGFATEESSRIAKDLEAAAAQQHLMAELIPAGELTLLKSVQPDFPKRAAQSNTSGWVELDYTVSEIGRVTDIAVHAASTPGVFEEAATKAVSQWRYQPVLRNLTPVAVRTRVRIRFELP